MLDTTSSDGGEGEAGGVAFVKLRVESLIEREYLQRNSTDKGVLEYLA